MKRFGQSGGRTIWGCPAKWVLLGLAIACSRSRPSVPSGPLVLELSCPSVVPHLKTGCIPKDEAPDCKVAFRNVGPNKIYLVTAYDGPTTSPLHYEVRANDGPLVEPSPIIGESAGPPHELTPGEALVGGSTRLFAKYDLRPGKYEARAIYDPSISGDDDGPSGRPWHPPNRVYSSAWRPFTVLRDYRICSPPDPEDPLVDAGPPDPKCFDSTTDEVERLLLGCPPP